MVRKEFKIIDRILKKKIIKEKPFFKAILR